MKKQTNILFWLFLCLFFAACKLDSQEKEPAQKGASAAINRYSGAEAPTNDSFLIEKIAPKDLISYIRQWNEVHNKLDTHALHLLYNDYVFYYGKDKSLKEVLTDKAKFFAKYPDFQQKLAEEVRIIQPAEDKNNAIFRFKKIVTAGGKTQIYPAYIEIYRFEKEGFKIITEGDSLTDLLLLKRKHLYSEKVKVKNGNIFLTLPNMQHKQITNIGKDTNAVLSVDGKKIVFIRAENEDSRSLKIYDLQSQKDSTLWEDFWLNLVYFDSLRNCVFVNGNGPMGCCMAVGVLRVDLFTGKPTPIGSATFDSPIVSGANKGKFNMTHCGYNEPDKGGCWTQRWLYNELLQPIKALEKKQDMW